MPYPGRDGRLWPVEKKEGERGKKGEKKQFPDNRGARMSRGPPPDIEHLGCWIITQKYLFK